MASIPGLTNPEADSSKASWAHGPTHSEPEHVLNTDCVSPEQFLTDGEAGMAYADAVAASQSYYDTVPSVFLLRALLINAPDAVIGSRMSFIDGFRGNPLCFLGLLEPTNAGSVVYEGASHSHAIILNTRSEGGHVIVRGSGKATVLGGSSSGSLESSTSGDLAVIGVANSGPITISGGSTIFVGNVSNRGPNAVIRAMGVTGTLMHVENDGGSVIATSVTINAYSIISKSMGSIIVNGTIEAPSVIHIELVGCYESTVSIGEHVSGSLSYMDGCGVTVTNAGTVNVNILADDEPEDLETTTAEFNLISTTSSASPDSQIVSRSVTMTITVQIDFDPNDPDNAARAEALKQGIKNALELPEGMDDDDVTITFVVTPSAGRRLQISDVQAVVDIDVPPTVEVDDVTAAAAAVRPNAVTSAARQAFEAADLPVPVMTVTDVGAPEVVSVTRAPTTQNTTFLDGQTFAEKTSFAKKTVAHWVAMTTLAALVC